MTKEQHDFLSENAVMTVKEMAKIMKICKPKAYELVHSGDFPVITVGNAIRIPCRAFFAWLNSTPTGG